MLLTHRRPCPDTICAHASAPAVCECNILLSTSWLQFESNTSGITLGQYSTMMPCRIMSVCSVGNLIKTVKNKDGSDANTTVSVCVFLFKDSECHVAVKRSYMCTLNKSCYDSFLFPFSHLPPFYVFFLFSISSPLSVSLQPFILSSFAVSFHPPLRLSLHHKSINTSKHNLTRSDKPFSSSSGV